jgi:hypothetical protein
MEIYVKEFINSKFATYGEKACEIKEQIKKHLDEKILIDFKGIDLVNSLFLRKAIGELFKEKELVHKLEQNLSIKNLDEDDLEILNSKIIPLYKNYAEVEKSQKEFFNEIQN